MNQVIKGIILARLPWRIDKSHDSNFSDAVLNAHRLIPFFNSGVTTHALFTRARVSVVHGFLIRTGSDTFAVSLAPGLIDENNPIFFSLVDRLSRTRSKTRRISAMSTSSWEIEKPIVMREA
jgi:hypothetical protein